MTTLNTTIRHHRLEELEALLKEDGVPLEKLKDAFILVNREVLKQPELVEVMGAEDIGLVTRTAQKLLDIKLATPAAKKKSAPKTAKGKINSILRASKAEEEEEDWDDL